MRILHVNKFLYRRGGAEGYMLDLADRQRARGHEVEFFGMRHEDNPPTRFEDRFPTQVEFDPAPPDLAGKVRATGRLLWSTSSARGMREVVESFRPDLVHLHNIYHQLSPSILRPLERQGVPAVMTLHDYKLACPTYRFLDHGEVCEACLGRRFHQAILRRCNRGSLGASALNALEMTLHTFGGAYAPIDLFACPSRFLEAKMREAGVFPDRLRWIPNFVDVGSVRPQDEPGRGAVYAGRLSHEKGVDLLLDAVAGLDVELDVAGEGPERERLEAQAASLGIGDRVRFHGRLATGSLHELMRRAAVALVPSRYYENQPLAVLEAFACGLPVVGTRLGGIPELIEPGTDGELVDPDEAGALADAIAGIAGDPARAHEMGRAARRKVEERFDPARHLERLDEIYAEAGERAARR